MKLIDTICCTVNCFSTTIFLQSRRIDTSFRDHLTFLKTERYLIDCLINENGPFKAASSQRVKTAKLRLRNALRVDHAILAFRLGSWRSGQDGIRGPRFPSLDKVPEYPPVFLFSQRSIKRYVSHFEACTCLLVTGSAGLLLIKDTIE